MRLIGLSKGRVVEKAGQGGGRLGLEGYSSLILELNYDCEDILEVLMKCR